MPKFAQSSLRLTAWTAVAVIAIVASLFLAKVSNAQTGQGTGQALEISPPVMTLTTDPGKTIKTRINVRNVSKTDLIVKGEANDFVADGEGGTPKVLLEPGETSPYSIKSWISAPASITLVPQEIKTMEITIAVPADASPGGHYGVIRFTGTPPDLEGQGVSLSASLGSLILLSVNGNVKENLSVEEFSVNKNGKSGTFFDSTPTQIVERIKNSGNTHEQPAGSVTITNMFNKSVASFSYNPQSRYILPGSIRKFDQSLEQQLHGKHLFGKYTATLAILYGKDYGQQLNSTVTFWVIPWKIILIVIAVLIAGFFLIRFGIKRYNRAVVKRAGRR
jgi:hypothetical protein